MGAASLINHHGPDRWEIMMEQVAWIEVVIPLDYPGTVNVPATQSPAN
jgi:hypothetical protein